jgi:phage gpG-like protein
MADPLGLSIKAKGDDVASRHLTELAKRGDDPRPAFREIVEDVRSAEADWFASEGRGSWPPLAARTLAAKARAGHAGGALVATGALRRSLTVKRGAGAVRSATKRQMKFGTKVHYARFHDTGEGAPKRRVMIPLDARARREMVKDVRDYMMGRTTPFGRVQ